MSLDIHLDHVALPVRDPRESREFYTRILGLRLSHAMNGDDWEGHPWLLLFFRLADGRQLALSSFKGARREPESGLPRDARHTAFGVEALEPWIERLRAGGIPFVEEDHGAQRSVLFQDPDGHVLELTSPPTPRVRQDPRQSGDGPDAERVLEAWLTGA